MNSIFVFLCVFPLHPSAFFIYLFSYPCYFPLSLFQCFPRLLLFFLLVISLSVFSLWLSGFLCISHSRFYTYDISFVTFFIPLLVVPSSSTCPSLYLFFFRPSLVTLFITLSFCSSRRLVLLYYSSLFRDNIKRCASLFPFSFSATLSRDASPFVLREISSSVSAFSFLPSVSPPPQDIPPSLPPSEPSPL